ncbi:shikimate kinase [Protaetiibacter intestinalis]|uniref:Shikimate kinase n=1 Tax=Protaetiibacter intestinalis TaxID=2419774 RepID=A0A387B5W6_9MICO|nr:shikimate kinase [Protaetiibacter intestinalis]AYF99114.1 shikimate kinase [Protaetiibacter intestinalis]
MSGPLAVFVGPMGSGKTRIGKRVAAALGVPFTDTDKVIVAQHGPIAELFDTHGEPHFRALERDTVREALTGAGIVSLGGGAVLDASTRELLAAHRVVYLTITAEAVASRLGDGKRPLVRGGIGDWQRIYDERKPVYESLASVTFDTSRLPYDRIAADVVTWLEAR